MWGRRTASRVDGEDQAGTVRFVKPEGRLCRPRAGSRSSVSIGSFGWLTSATVAARAAIRSAGAGMQVDPEPAAADRHDRLPGDRRVGDHRPGPARPERGDRVALVSGRRRRPPPRPGASSGGRRAGLAAWASRSAGRPGRGRTVVALAAPDDDRPQELAVLDSLEDGRLLGARGAGGPDDRGCGIPAAAIASAARVGTVVAASGMSAIVPEERDFCGVGERDGTICTMPAPRNDRPVEGADARGTGRVWCWRAHHGDRDRRGNRQTRPRPAQARPASAAPPFRRCFGGGKRAHRPASPPGSAPAGRRFGRPGRGRRWTSSWTETRRLKPLNLTTASNPTSGRRASGRAEPEAH